MIKKNSNFFKSAYETRKQTGFKEFLRNSIKKISENCYIKIMFQIKLIFLVVLQYKIILFFFFVIKHIKDSGKQK
jgi:hypothetical protein